MQRNYCACIMTSCIFGKGSVLLSWICFVRAYLCKTSIQHFSFSSGKRGAEQAVLTDYCPYPSMLSSAWFPKLSFSLYVSKWWTTDVKCIVNTGTRSEGKLFPDVCFFGWGWYSFLSRARTWSHQWQEGMPSWTTPFWLVRSPVQWLYQMCSYCVNPQTSLEGTRWW